jgi:flavorubredoxin
MITNRESATRVDEIAAGIYRISTPVPVVPGGFSFNQYLVLDEQPLLFHTGPRKMFPLVRGAIAAVMPVERLRYISFSHYEADECGALNEFLSVAPEALPLCGQIAAMVSISDVADRAPVVLGDGETRSLGRHIVRWLDTPHLPHAWECGFLMEESTKTLLCGDLFTQGGAEHAPLTEADILEPSEAFRLQLDYYSHTRNGRGMMERLAALEPTTLACMHGSAWRGDGAVLLRALGHSLETS